MLALVSVRLWRSWGKNDAAISIRDSGNGARDGRFGVDGRDGHGDGVRTHAAGDGDGGGDGDERTGMLVRGFG